MNLVNGKKQLHVPNVVRIASRVLFLTFEFQKNRSSNLELRGSKFPVPIDKVHRLHKSLLLPHKQWFVIVQKYHTVSASFVYIPQRSDVILLSVGGEVRDQSDQWDRFAVILYYNNRRQFVFSARRWNNTESSYICQLQQQGLLIVQPHSTEWNLSMLYSLSKESPMSNG